MFTRLHDAVDEWVVIPEAQLRQTVARMVTDVKLVAEGAGALAYAAMSEAQSRERTVAILSGGNIDSLRLAGLLDSTHAA
jgi:threonine dehydratase